MNKKRLNIFVLITSLVVVGGYSQFILNGNYVARANNMSDGRSTIPRVTSNLISNLVNGELVLTWSNPFPVLERSNPDNGFKIERSLSVKSGYSEIATLAATEESFTDAGASADTVYYYRTCSFSRDNVSSYSNITTPQRTVRKDVLAVDGQFEQSVATNFTGGVGWASGGEVYYDDVSLAGVSIQNEGFETSGTGGDDVFSSWNEFYDQSENDTTISTDLATVHGGSSAAKLTLRSGAITYETKIQNQVSVIAGNYYTLSFWTKTLDGVNAGRYAVRDIVNGTDIISLRSTGIVSMEYKQVTIKFKAPSGCTSIYIELYAPGPNRGADGSRESVADDTVGDQWKKVTDYSVLYDDDLESINDNTEYNLEAGTGINGSHSQTMSLIRNSQNSIPARYTQNQHYTQIWRTLINRRDINGESGVDESIGTSDFVPGQTYEFKLDKIYLDHTGTLPGGTTASYFFMINNDSTTLNLTNTSAENPTSFTKEFVAPTDLFVDSVGRTVITLRICIYLYGNTGDFKPTLHFDGAHLYPKDESGNYLSEQVPAPRDRNINTGMVAFVPSTMRAYDIATRFDQIMLGWPEYYMVPIFRRYNPNAKIFYYYPAPNITEMRKEKSGEYVPFGVSLIKDAFSAPPDGSPGELYADRWFSKYPGGAAMAVDDQRLASDIPIVENYVIGTNYNPPSYEVKIDDPDYQRILTEKLTPFLETMGADGVFFDVLNDTIGSQDYEDDGIDLKKEAYRLSAYQVQSFQNYVFPRIRASGFEIMQNACCRSSLAFPGCSYLDPNFEVSDLPVEGEANYTSELNSTSSLYSNNSPAMIADYWFDEWAFWNHTDGERNYYAQTMGGKNRWKATLDDMDKRVLINNSLPRDERRMISLNISGVDRTEEPSPDPGDGINGWRNFALTSYMLAKSEYSYLGNTEKYNNREGYPIGLDMSRSNLLGEPMEARNKNASASYSDETLQSRTYSKGIAVANGSPTESRDYTIPEDVLDNNNNLLVAGTVVTLPAHSGRIYLFTSSNRTIDISNNKLVSYSSRYTLTGVKNAEIRNVEAMFEGKRYYATVTPTTWSIIIDVPSSGLKTVTVYDSDFPDNTIEQVEISRRKVGDINGDGFVSSADLVALIVNWNTNTPDPTKTSDFNEDGFVDQTDFSGMMFNWN